MTLKREEVDLLGVLVKTHGFNGELVLKAGFPLKDRYEKMESVFLLINGILVPFFLEEFEISADKTAILKFEDVNTRNDAEKLREKSVFILKSSSEFNSNAVRNQDFTGFELRNEKGRQMGIIKDLIEIAKNPLFVVNVNGVEVLVPANEELIIEINPGEKHICLRIPDGLIPHG
jgi:16S rRNA processing protein RimM